MTEDQAKEKIQKLITRYENLTSHEKRMNEETTKAKFIRPLFEALGWDFEEDVILEDKISHGRVDYNFQLNGQTKFFVEAKPLKANLDDLNYAKQATNYAWLKNVNWAVLTDFEGIRIFYPAQEGQAKACFRLNWQNYLKDFEDLWILSKDSFKKNLLDEKAIKWGAKPEKTKVSQQLAKDLNQWRTALNKDFKSWNEKITIKELDEGIQKILDRFIFIRTCEDRGLENKTLRSEYRIWQDQGRKGNFLSHLKPIFREYQEIYNSGLFEYHPCVEWECDSTIFDQIINGLYQSQNGQVYDFSAINADVLGSVYEQYLGYLLQKSGDGDQDKKKRKSHGIYYTPTFIVDYIIQNSLVEKLKEIKSIHELKQLKVLDPACGSGSFLIKALEAINNKYKDMGNSGNEFTKIDILLNNIYGVDLDEQAVEIAKLNLLLQTLETESKLPSLTDNIKNGNSLIDDSQIASNKAFKWSDEFPFCHSEQNEESGGFDIIIGNPPYGAILNKHEKDFFFANYKTSQFKLDTYTLFIEKALNLLKKDGYLGFIIPNTLLDNYFLSNLREKLLQYKIVSINLLDDKVFAGAVVHSMIIILQKTACIDNSITIYNHKNNFTFSVRQKNFRKNKYLIFNTSQRNSILDKVIKNSIDLKETISLRQAIKTGNDKKFIQNIKNSDNWKPILRGRDIARFGYYFSELFVNYSKHLACPRDYKIFEQPKILIRETGNEIIATYDKNNYYIMSSIYVGVQKNKLYDLKYILALLNSRLYNYYMKMTLFSKREGAFTKAKIFHYDLLPICIIDFSNPKEKAKHDELVKLADKMLKLNANLQKEKQGTNCWNQINSEIHKTDHLIDQKVYKLYGLNKKEIEIIEGEKNDQ